MIYRGGQWYYSLMENVYIVEKKYPTELEHNGFQKLVSDMKNVQNYTEIQKDWKKMR